MVANYSGKACPGQLVTQSPILDRDFGSVVECESRRGRYWPPGLPATRLHVDNLFPTDHFPPCVGGIRCRAALGTRVFPGAVVVSEPARLLDRKVLRRQAAWVQLETAAPPGLERGSMAGMHFGYLVPFLMSNWTVGSRKEEARRIPVYDEALEHEEE